MAGFLTEPVKSGNWLRTEINRSAQSLL